jgi:glyoxylase-like metal-dependent hydrolase (beta-lactamase superfamily II)
MSVGEESIPVAKTRAVTIPTAPDAVPQSSSHHFGLTSADAPVQGTFTTTAGRRLVVHTYTAPENGWLVTSHLIELPDQIVVIDGQYLLPYAREAIAFAKRLNKPITRLYVTHYHPDHHLGAEAFDAPIYALVETKAKIEAIGERLAREERAKFPETPDVVPTHATSPQLLVEPGVELIGGRKFDFRVLRHAETKTALTVALPDDDILITQDLVYNQVHLFLGEKYFDEWEGALNEYRRLSYSHILGGHGLPGGPELYDQMKVYLEFAKSALAQSVDGEELKTKLIRRFPQHRGLGLIEHEKRFLFRAIERG